MKFPILLLVVLLGPIYAFAQTELIAPTLSGESLVTYLRNEYSVTSSKSYTAARDAMFEDIDGANGTISCVYTGYTISFTNRINAQDQGLNTEHSWPQSFYDQASPMRTDIHHLYPTRSDVNSARSNYDFAEIPDEFTDRWYRNSSNQTTIPTSNIDEYSELDVGGTNRFEPREDHKGNVARAMFYFWTMYQNHSAITSDATDNEAFFNRIKDDLLAWHLSDQVDQEEVNRSIAIEGVQGNRNPFVHDTTLVRRAFFGGTAIDPGGMPNPLTGRIENIENTLFEVHFTTEDGNQFERFLYGQNFTALDTAGNSFTFGDYSSIFNAEVSWEGGGREGEFIANQVRVLLFEDTTATFTRTEAPYSFQLHQNYPNPFNPSTTISYTLDQPNYVKLEVFSATGQLVEVLESTYLAEGTHQSVFNAGDLASGVYFYILRIDGNALIRKMTILK